jgi:murein DD-endopeptidase MepM/ murein hydrolase activator NlpD
MNLSRILSASLLLSLAVVPAVPVTDPVADPVAVALLIPRGVPVAADLLSWPLAPPHPVIGPFQAPATDYASGHRGLDLAAVPGTAVFAPVDGIVSFTGVVVDRPVVSMIHAGDLVSSVEPVVANVAVGEHVTAGQLIGQVGVGGHCADRCVHFGLRLHGRYVSPLLFLGGIPRAVLLPAPQARG